MKLLVITNNKKHASFRQRIEIYLDILHANGIDCEVAKLPSDTLARRKLFKQTTDFDGVFLHRKSLNILDANWLRRYARKVIYDFDDAIMYSTKRPEQYSSSHFKPFRRTAELADMVIAGNTYLAEHARKFNSNVEILPTGLNTSRYKLLTDVKSDRKIRLVWIGSRSTLKYLVYIKSALEEIGTRFDDVILRIICDVFFDLQNMKVEKCVWSKDTESGDLGISDIGLAPLPDDRFTRGKCGFKILQYEAANLPVIASPVGVNTDYVLDGISGFHASSIHQWIDRIGELINNLELRKRMGDAGKAQAQRFDINVLGDKLSGLVTKCMRGSANAVKSIGWSGGHSKTHAGCEEIKVSICIPTYNRKGYLKETIESILAQTYRNYEIIVVDDGSTDGTEDMIKQLGVPITYYWQENSGDAAARNKLIELAQGEYISFIDSDDLLFPDAIERLVKVMEAEKEDIVAYGSYVRIDQDGKVYGKSKRKLYSGNITKQLFQTVIVHSCGSMFPRKILKGTITFDTSLNVCSDYDRWLSLSMEYKFVALPAPTFKRRRHLENLSTVSFENCLTEFKVLERFYYEKGGDKVVPSRVALKVLSKSGFKTGRCAIMEGLYSQAAEFFGQSFWRHPNLRSLFYWMKAVIAKKLAS